MARVFNSKIDYFSVSFPTDSSGMVGGYSPGGFYPVEFIQRLQYYLLQCGLDAVQFEKRPAGMYSYHYSFNVLRPDFLSKSFFSCGLIAYSDDSSPPKYNRGFFLSLTGLGCMGVDFKKLKDFLELYDPKLTRIDIAVDYYYGEVTFKQIKRLYYEGAFVSGGRHPRFHMIAPKRLLDDGVEVDKAGSYTLYVGKRGSKMARCYEKGLQLTLDDALNPFIDWFRIEIELRSEGCQIPLSVVDNLDGALFGAYPHLFERLPNPSHVFQSDKLKDLKIIKLIYDIPEFRVPLSHLIHWLKTSYGGVINMLKQMSLDDTEIVSLLSPTDDKKIPRRLLFPKMGDSLVFV